jgi:hypothetical protein
MQYKLKIKYTSLQKNILTGLWFEIQLRYTIHLTSVVATTPQGIIILSSDVLPACGPVGKKLSQDLRVCLFQLII